MKRMRWYDYITYNIYWLGLNMATGSLTPIILPFLVAGFVGDAVKGTYLGMLRSAGLIVAIIVQPMAGLLSDRSTLRWGRRRPFIFVGTVLDLVFLAVIGLSGNYWLLFAAVLLLQFSSNVAHGALQGIIPDLVPEDQRGRASGVKAVMELLPIILVGFTTGPLVGAGNVALARENRGATEASPDAHCVIDAHLCRRDYTVRGPGGRDRQIAEWTPSPATGRCGIGGPGGDGWGDYPGSVVERKSGHRRGRSQVSLFHLVGG